MSFLLPGYAAGMTAAADDPETAAAESSAQDTVPADPDWRVLDLPDELFQGLSRDTLSGDAADMTPEERGDFLQKMVDANDSSLLWQDHQDVNVIYRSYDEEEMRWKEYNTIYAAADVYYQDDFTPGLEQLQILMLYGPDECVENYADSIHYVRFLNASGTPWSENELSFQIFDGSTPEEELLSVIRTGDALYAVTVLSDDAAGYYGISTEDPSSGEPGQLPVNIYVLDPETMRILDNRIRLYHGSSFTEVMDISTHYDKGMTDYVRAGYDDLMRHIDVENAWAPEDLKNVSLTLDPGAENEKTFSITALKGDPVSTLLPNGYILYSDEALTQEYIDNGDYSSDIILYGGPAPSEETQELSASEETQELSASGETQELSASGETEAQA